MKIIVGHEKIKNNFEKLIIKNEINFKLIANKYYRKNLRYLKNFNQQIKDFSHNGKYSKLIDLKLPIYRKHLAKKLNIIHNTNYSSQYWGLLIDTFLTDFLGAIISDYDSLKKIKKKYNDLVFDYQKENIKSYNSVYFTNNSYNPIFQRIFLSKSAKILNIKIRNRKSNFLYYNYNYFTNNYYIKIFNIFIKFLIKIFKPTLVEGDYAKLKYKFFDIKKIDGKYYLFFKSKLFSNDLNYNANLNWRSQLKLGKNLDNIDKIFSNLISDFFPASYLENFKIIRSGNKKLAKSIKFFVVTTFYRFNDRLKILAADLKYLNKSKIIHISHAPFENLRKKSRSYFYCKKYSNKYLSYNNNLKNKLYQNKIIHLKRFKKLNHQNKIIIFSTATRAFHNNNFYICSKENHPYYASDLSFYKNLNASTKQKTYIKLFPSIKDSYNITKNIWVANNKDKVNFVEKNFNFDDLYNFNLLILNEVSTALFESLLTKRPFILIYENSFINLKDNIKTKFFNLKKYKIVFKSSFQASSYINKNLGTFLKNWKKVSNSKEFNELRGFICGQKF